MNGNDAVKSILKQISSKKQLRDWEIEKRNNDLFAEKLDCFCLDQYNENIIELKKISHDNQTLKIKKNYIKKIDLQVLLGIDNNEAKKTERSKLNFYYQNFDNSFKTFNFECLINNFESIWSEYSQWKLERKNWFFYNHFAKYKLYIEINKNNTEIINSEILEINNRTSPHMYLWRKNELKWIQQNISNWKGLFEIYSKVESNKMYQGVFLLIWILMI